MSITIPARVNTESIRLRYLVVILRRADVLDLPQPGQWWTCVQLRHSSCLRFEGQTVKSRKIASPSYNGIRHIYRSYNNMSRWMQFSLPLNRQRAVYYPLSSTPRARRACLSNFFCVIHFFCIPIITSIRKQWIKYKSLCAWIINKCSWVESSELSGSCSCLEISEHVIHNFPLCLWSCSVAWYRW